MHGGGIGTVKKTEQTSIAASQAAREYSAAAEQMRTSYHIARSNYARREIREGAERVNGRAHGEEVSQKRHGATSCYAAIPITDADMQARRDPLKRLGAPRWGLRLGCAPDDASDRSGAAVALRPMLHRLICDEADRVSYQDPQHQHLRQHGKHQLASLRACLTPASMRLLLQLYAASTFAPHIHHHDTPLGSSTFTK
ncbi:hypothetical protein P171DRAFT_495865 [Karstenula rhodostoma CBS 690.94]|uniref:Uncharacterized protein n=1 Tax=Karstenula rhodostoma CBS 690.94 TaxID=1392251 RepID=A0A9P4U8U3_9PLEO|nr:hypothetical protein P171DRAFT_495865 [Karstenula rhodostoma CBS 690.94]